MKPITQDEEFIVRRIVSKLWQLKIISTKEFSGLTSGRIKPRLEIEL